MPSQGHGHRKTFWLVVITWHVGDNHFSLKLLSVRLVVSPLVRMTRTALMAQGRTRRKMKTRATSQRAVSL